MWSAGIAPPFLTSALNGGTHWIRVWMGPKVGLDVVEKRKILYSHQMVGRGTVG
jgi:hypothetical protein